MYNRQHLPTEVEDNGKIILNPHLIPMMRHTATTVRVHPAPARDRAERPAPFKAPNRRQTRAREELTRQALADARAWAERQGA